MAKSKTATRRALTAVLLSAPLACASGKSGGAETSEIGSEYRPALDGGPRDARRDQSSDVTKSDSSSELTIVWSDEFNGANGSAPDGTKWGYDTGGGGWGNEELETYTTSTKNAYQQDGNLIIKVNKETATGTDGISRDYTSARLVTKSKFSATYGRFEARIKIPYGQGLWPAFWMLGDNIGSASWPACGEIDVMENIGKEPATVHGTIHGSGYSGSSGIGSYYSLSSGKFADDFHVFAVEWEASAIRFYVDGNLYATRTPSELPSGSAWAFDHAFYMLLNVAVGGTWPGAPDSTTTFPQTMQVDYVRVYQ